jgi:Cu(I)/Ag(I) efflux system membrane fusion protein
VVGSVAYDTRQSGAISARVSGRIERLYIRYKYQPVKKGQRIMDIYSPGLVTAQQNLLFLLRNDADNASLINAAKERLALLGMSANQIAQVISSQRPKYSVPVFSNYSGFVTDLDKMNNTVPPENMQVVTPSSQQLTIKEGMYVQSGQPVFSVYNSDRAWILLDIFPEQQNLIQQGNDVRIVPETAPQKNFRGKIDYIEPIFRTGNKTLTARIYFNNSSLHLPVGSRVTATIFASSKTANWLPQEAVLSLGRDKVVFKKEQGGFRTSKINTGMVLNQYVQVTGGIEKTDSIAKNAQFLIDNEAFIKVNEP